jgi:hypothetical protein
MPSGTSFSSRSSPWHMRPLLWLRRSTALLPVIRHLPGDRPLALRRPGPLPAPHLSSLRPLVRRPSVTAVVVPARVAVGVAAPLVVVPPGRGGGQAWSSLYNPWTGTIAMWPGQAPRASRPPVPTLLTVPPYGVPPTPPYGVPASHPAPPHLLPLGTPTTTWSPLSRGWDNASLAAAFSTMAMTPPSSDWVIDSGASYHTTPTTGTLSRSHPPPLLSSFIDRRWERFHSARHLSRCLGSPWTVLPQRRSRCSPHHS